MAGLLGNISSGLRGLLGDPALSDALWLTIAAGADPRRADQLREEKRLSLQDEKEAEYRALQAQHVNMQLQAAKEQQQRQQQSQGALASLSLLAPEYQAMYRNDPAFQQAFRANQVVYGDPAAAEQAGVLAPLPKPMEMTAEGKNYQLSKSDPGFAEWMKQNQAGANPGGLFAPTIVRNADGTFSAWQPGNKPGMPPVLTPLPGNPINSDVELAALLARERASAGAQGKAEGTAIAGAPEAIGKLDDAITDVTRLVADPAIDSAYGVIQGRTPTVRQGTQDFEAKRDKLIYTLGLAARGQLAGTGQISNFEQEMLLKAQSTLANPLISPQAAKEEMQRMLSWLQSKREKAA